MGLHANFSVIWSAPGGRHGGDQRDPWQLVHLLRGLAGGESPQEAIDSTVLHTTHLVSSFWRRGWAFAGLVAEERLGDDALAALEACGHRVTRAGAWRLGRLFTI